MKTKIILVMGLILLTHGMIYGAVNKPTAAFTFTKQVFQKSEEVTIVDRSNPAEADKIVTYEWRCIVRGREKKASSLKMLLKNVPVGQYTVSLRVKDNLNRWSDTVSQKVKLIEDYPMQLTSFYSKQTTYAIGEKLNLDYTYNNPNDLEVEGQRWRYRNLTTQSSTISGRPRYFKKAGLYEITLEIQDEWGNWSNQKSCKVNVTNNTINRDGYYLFEKGRLGDLIEGYINKDYNQYKDLLTINRIDTEGTLLMSNSPETIPSSGILYQDIVKGRGRLVLHHLNGTMVKKKLLVTVTNVTNESIALEMSQLAIKGPGKHIMELGQEAVKGYLDNKAVKKQIIPPGESKTIYTSPGAWMHQEVVTGTIDFESTGDLKWQIAALDVTSPESALKKLSILPRDTHDRGTFSTIERQYDLDLTHTTAPSKLVLGKEKEEWLKGIDATTGKPAHNRGNYGLPIKINIKSNEDIGVILNARGGDYRGALKWQEGISFNVPQEQVLKAQKVAALVGTARKDSENEFIYMLPNGSSAPVLFGFIPKSLWK